MRRDSHCLTHDLYEIWKRNRDGSYATKGERITNLLLIARQLREGGFKNLRAASLSPKHVDYLLNRWKMEGLATGTIKNRMAHIRWWIEKAGKAGTVPSENAALGIPARQYAGQPSKAQALDPARHERIKDPFVRASVWLAAAFGLRREEAIKIIPCLAWQGSVLYLQGSWCKGGRPRLVPIRTAEQRAALEYAIKVAGRGSLIPPHRTYIQQRRIYDAQIRTVGLGNLHGLRHEYAQGRYEELTGRQAPKAGGPERKTLTGQEREGDKAARLKVSKELGHNRPEILMTYCG